MGTRLTDPGIRALSAPTTRQQVIVYDSLVRGLGVRVTRNGQKAFILNYVNRAGRERRFTIGSTSDWKIGAAREEAKRLRRLVDTGGDPLAEVAAAREALTVSQIFDLYLAGASFADKSATVQSIDRGAINRHLRPLLGKKGVDTLTPDDVRTAMKAITEGKTAADVKTDRARGRARVTGGAGTARKAIRLLRATLNWSIREGLATANPVDHVQIGSDNQRDTLVDAAGFKAIFDAITALQAAGDLRPAAADAVRLIAETAARRGEITGLRWRNVDLERGVIVLQRGEHKTGKSTSKPRVIGLSTGAREIIARQPKGKADDFVFASRRGAQVPISLGKAWASIRDKAGVPRAVTLHTLRHSLASHMAMAGAEAAELMTLLGHTQLSTTSRYLHAAADARTAIAQRAADLIKPPK